MGDEIMQYPVYELLTIKIDHDMKEWLAQEAINQMSNMSVLTRQAIKLLQDKIEREAKE